jgi:5'(3')-deoxyribonucleotidase
MDGTIAKFNSKRNALARFDNEVGFFSSLKPFAHLDSINSMIQNNEVEVYVISASPNEQADKDKMTWLKKYLPTLKESNVCFCRLGQNKAQEIKKQLNITIDSNCYLLDDYTKNLIEWKDNKGIGIKRLTSLADNSTKRWTGLNIKDLNQLSTLLI